MSLDLSTGGIDKPYTCILCGFLVLCRTDAQVLSILLPNNGLQWPGSNTWITEFRALHGDHPFLSGVGRSLSLEPPFPCAHVPQDSDKRYDNAEDPPKLTIVARAFASGHEHNQPNIAYLIHSACWDMLRRQAEFRGIADLSEPRYTKFLYLLHHYSADGMGHDWAGNYGGLLYSSGQMVLSAIPEAMRLYHGSGYIEALVKRAKANQLRPWKPAPIFGRKRDSWKPLADNSDNSDNSSFTVLSFELILEIIKYLPTSDVLNFWLAYDRVPDFPRQDFWRSRFDQGMDLEYFGNDVAELYPLKNIPWYTIFWKARNVNYRGDTSSIRNHRRTLALANELIGLAKRYANTPIEGNPAAPVNSVSFHSQGYVAYELQVELPPVNEIRSVHVSSIVIAGRRYVSGIRINDATSGIGYCHQAPSETLYVDVDANDVAQSIGWYMDSSGVLAIYLVTEQGNMPSMNTDHIPVGNVSHGRLPMGERLIGHFDATKFVAIAVDTGSEEVNKNWGFDRSIAGTQSDLHASGTAQTVTANPLPN